MSIGLIAYAFRIKERNSNNRFINLDNVASTDISTFIVNFLRKWSGSHFYTNPQSIKAFSVSSFHVDEEHRRITGQFISGEGGIPAQIRNVNNINEIRYEKVSEDSECIPLYYLFHLPTTSMGILILERFRQLSVKHVLTNLLRKDFNDIYPNYTLTIEPLSQRRLMDMYLRDGDIKSITLSSFSSPSHSFEDRFEIDDSNIESLAMYEFTIRSRRNRNLNLCKRILTNIVEGRANIDAVNNLVGINDFRANEISANFEINGKTKKIRIDQVDDISAVYDISNELQDLNRHPNYEEINPLAIEYLESLIENE